MPLLPDPIRLGRLRRWLDQVQYDRVLAATRSAYRLTPYPRFDDLERLSSRLPEPLRTAYPLLLLGREANYAEAQSALGGEVLDDLVATGFVRRRGDALDTDGLSLVSYLERYFAVSLDPYYPAAAGRRLNAYIGPSSFALAQAMPAIVAGKAVLDLCSGPAFHAVLLAPTAARVVATDLDPHSTAAARFNAALNSVADKVEVREGNLYASVAAERFDVIVTNTPFVAAPDGVDLPGYLGGGPDGMRLMGPALEGMATHLTDDGRGYFYFEGLGDARGPFLVRYLEDIGRRCALGFELVVARAIPIEEVLEWRSTMTARTGTSGVDAWRRFYRASGADRYVKLVGRVHRGGGVSVIDPGLGAGGLAPVS